MRGFFENAILLLVLICICWGLEFIDFVTRHFLDNFGIRPRRIMGIPGIFTAHWLHNGFSHLLSNTAPFFVLGGFVLLGGRALFWKVTTFVALVGGALLWLIGGKGENHIGASLVIFGYLGFLLTRGIFEKSPLWITVSIITLLFYGGMVFGILPGKTSVSWVGHLSGFICGIICARTMLSRNRVLYQIDRGEAA